MLIPTHTHTHRHTQKKTVHDDKELCHALKRVENVGFSVVNVCVNTVEQ